MSFQFTVGHEITDVLLEEGAKTYIVQVLYMKNSDQVMYTQCVAS